MKNVLKLMSMINRASYHEAIDAAARIASMDSVINEEIKVYGILKGPLMKNVHQTLCQAIGSCDALIADISVTDSGTLYELGYAHALMKPTIMLRRHQEQIPFDLANERFIAYSADTEGLATFEKVLAKELVVALTNPEKWTFGKHKASITTPSVFISYSHMDLAFLQRLQIHLKPLEKNSIIDLWDDTKIAAGTKWKHQIEEALQRARIAILLISADFLASDFIVENELPPILKNAEEKGTTILPVIVKPSRFLRDRNLSQFQAINDPNKPIQALPESEQEKIYARIAERIEQELS